MHVSGRGWRRLAHLLAAGAITLSWVQSLGQIDFASIFTSFLTIWLSALVALFLGADPQNVLGSFA